ncbi:MAG: radical SAM protein [Desulfovibrio sp.]|nr:radical SAM protein [Desulfovibrio sp.]
MTHYPSKLYVETTTRCNLRCSMCVKYAEGACIPEKDMSLDVFKQLQPAFPTLDTLLLNGIGEPLMTPEFPEMIRFAREHMRPEASIRFQTNGMLITESRAVELVESGVDTVCLSVDMVSEDGVFHGGESVDRISHVFEYFQRAAKSAGRSVTIGVEFVLMRENAQSLPRSIAWAAEHGAQFVLVTHMLPYTETTMDQELFNPNTELSMAEFMRWQAEADAAGFDLSEFFGLGWKFHKTPEQRELVRFVTSRQQAALAKNIPINLKSLLLWASPEKQAEQQWLASILAKAQQIAKDMGVNVTLPPVAATYDRTCDFVEQGVAHITPDGDVRPCYFLWHEYSCYMDGGKKRITPKTFGNIMESSIVDIWNSAAYRTFRQEVLEYDYPYCSNCSVVPCSDVTGSGNPFQQDCYGLTIPCGHCLWCMGGVRCLL